MRKACIAVCALAFSLAAPATAQDVEEGSALPSTEARVPNFLGATGLLINPTAYTVGDRSASLFFAGSERPDFIGGGAVAGITDRFELGFGVIDFDAADTEFLLNAKFNLLPETEQVPAISVGVIDALDELNTSISWYFMVSKYFTRAQTDANFALKGHIGFGGGIYDENIIAGAELFFKPYFSLIAEYNDPNDLSVGGRFHYRGWTGTLAFLDFDDIAGAITYNIVY